MPEPSAVPAVAPVVDLPGAPSAPVVQPSAPIPSVEPVVTPVVPVDRLKTNWWLIGAVAVFSIALAAVIYYRTRPKPLIPVNQ